MIDLHFHALPGIDDGPRDLDEAITLVGAAKAAGVDAIVATPHVSWTCLNDAHTILTALRELREALEARSIAMAIHPGAEIALTRALDLSDDELARLRLGAGPWVLIEPPLAPRVSGVEDMLYALEQRGARIVLAHVERCPAFLEDDGLLRRLVERGMLASVTAGSLTGRFGPVAKRCATQFIAAGLIHNVASDAHDPVMRPPTAPADILAAGLHEQADWLTGGVPDAILRGRSIPPPPPWPAPPEHRSRFARLRP
jgi:protein-tyrosine phosphatase